MERVQTAPLSRASKDATTVSISVNTESLQHARHSAEVNLFNSAPPSFSFSHESIPLRSSKVCGIQCFQAGSLLCREQFSFLLPPCRTHPSGLSGSDLLGPPRLGNTLCFGTVALLYTGGDCLLSACLSPYMCLSLGQRPVCLMAISPGSEEAGVPPLGSHGP